MKKITHSIVSIIALLAVLMATAQLPGNSFRFDGINDYAIGSNISVLDITSGTIIIRFNITLTASNAQTLIAYKSDGPGTRYLFNLLPNLS